MALDDLDLEFEDEEEAKKKKNEAFHVDVDLEFHQPDAALKARPRPGSPNGTEVNRPIPAPIAEVIKIDDARAAAQVKRPATAPAGVRPEASGAPRSSGSSALKSEPHYDLESEEVIQLREKVRRLEVDSEVRAQVAEFKSEIMGELLGDMKLMEHQINQLLVRINAKHPDMKQEALMIKKILADFTTKKRK